MFPSRVHKSAVQAGGLWAAACSLPLTLSAAPRCNHTFYCFCRSLRSAERHVESHQSMRMEYRRSLSCSCTSRFAKLTSFACPDPRRSGRTSLLSGAPPTAVAVGWRGFSWSLVRFPRWTLVSSRRCHSLWSGETVIAVVIKTARKGEMRRRLGRSSDAKWRN